MPERNPSRICSKGVQKTLKWRDIGAWSPKSDGPQRIIQDAKPRRLSALQIKSGSSVPSEVYIEPSRAEQLEPSATRSTSAESKQADLGPNDERIKLKRTRLR